MHRALVSRVVCVAALWLHYRRNSGSDPADCTALRRNRALSGLRPIQAPAVTAAVSQLLERAPRPTVALPLAGWNRHGDRDHDRLGRHLDWPADRHGDTERARESPNLKPDPTCPP